MNRIPTRSGCFTPGHLRLNGLILALALGLTTLPLPSLANMSNATNGRIHGRAPDVTGTPIIQLPGGTAPVTNNAQVLWTAKPSDFTLAPLSSYVTYVDADGDLPQGTGYSMPPSGGVSWVWTTSGGATLNASQLSQPFQTNFADGTVLKVYASVNVNVASVSGMPNARVRTLHSRTFEVVVRKPLAPPKVYVNGVTFAGDAGFPKTGFLGANFQFFMNGTNIYDNGRYTYTTNQPGWTTVSSSGVVHFHRMPTAAEKAVTIRISDNHGMEPDKIFEFTVSKWFVNRGNVYTNASGASVYCAGLGNGYAIPSYTYMTNTANLQINASRAADGRLWDEWGSLDAYSGWAWDPGKTRQYYASERASPTSISQSAVDLSNGKLYTTDNRLALRAVCWRAL